MFRPSNLQIAGATVEFVSFVALAYMSNIIITALIYTVIVGSQFRAGRV